MAKIVGLQQLVAELREADAGLAAEAIFYTVLGDHAAEREVLADVAQKIEEADRRGPIGVVDDPRGISSGGKIEESPELDADSAVIVGELLAAEQIAFGGLAARVSDHAGSAAGEADCVMTRQLKAAQRQLRHQVTDVERVPGRIEAAIKRDRPRAQALGERSKVGAIGDEAAPLEVFDQVHQGRES